MKEKDPILCFLCSYKAPNRQAFRAHLKKHKGELMRTTIWVIPDKWRRFNAFVRKHGLTTCHLLHAFFDFCEIFDRTGHATLSLTDTLKAKIDVGSFGSNPISFHLHQTFLGKPRSSYKMLISEETIASAIPDPEMPSGWYRCSHCGLSYYPRGATIWTCPKCKRKVIATSLTQIPKGK